MHLLLLQVTSVLCPGNAATRVANNLDACETLWAFSLGNGHTPCRSLTLDLHDPLKRARPDHLDVRRGAFSDIFEITALTPQSIIPIISKMCLVLWQYMKTKVGAFGSYGIASLIYFSILQSALSRVFFLFADEKVWTMTMAKRGSR